MSTSAVGASGPADISPDVRGAFLHKLASTFTGEVCLQLVKSLPQKWLL